MIDLGKLHAMILEFIIKNGFAPTEFEIAQFFTCSEKDARESLFALQEYHGVVLHPNGTKIWVIHPFSLAPTLFTVKSSHGIWWGNCAWCSFGVAALLNEDVTITSTIGGHEEQVSVNIRNGKLERDDLFVHFPIKMKNAWDNVIYTCSSMLLFRNEKEVKEWAKRHNIPSGDVQPISKIWEFSKVWYGNHLKPEWKKWTAKEAKEIFTKFGLTSNTWDLEESAKRF